ncbi:MAG: hypothetical protein V1789_06470, partial [PVC group bacterium]
MKKLNLLVFDTSIDLVTEGIIESGLLHPAQVSQLDPWAEELQPEAEGEARQWQPPLLNRGREVLKKLGPGGRPLPGPEPAFQPVGREEAEGTLREAESRLNPLWLEKEAREEELSTQERMLAEVKTFALDKLGFSWKGKYSFLEVALGQVAETNLPILEAGLKPIPHVLLPVQTASGKVTLLVIVLRKDRVVLEKNMAECGFTRAELPPGRPELNRELVRKIQTRIEDLQTEIAAADRKLALAAEELAPRLRALLDRLQLGQTIERATTYVRKTRRTYLISGWIPGRQVPVLVAKIRELTGGRCFFEFQDPEEIEGV